MPFAARRLEITRLVHMKKFRLRKRIPKQPASTFSITERISSTGCSGSSASMCKKNRMSPLAASAPIFICIPRPFELSRKRIFPPLSASASRSTARVPSLLPPSTKMISHRPSSRSRFFTKGCTSATSLYTGTMTEMTWCFFKYSPEWPFALSRNRSRSSMVSISHFSSRRP